MQIKEADTKKLQKILKRKTTTEEAGKLLAYFELLNKINNKKLCKQENSQ